MIPSNDSDLSNANSSDWFQHGDKLAFIGLDLAPSDSLETGLVALDRKRQLMRMDKLSTDDSIIQYLKSYMPLKNCIVMIDVPKNLNIPGKWRQEQMKYHPLVLKRKPLHLQDWTRPLQPDEDLAKLPYITYEDSQLMVDTPETLGASASYAARCSDRTWELYDQLVQHGATVGYFFGQQAKMLYDLEIPFRTRTPQGCRALQMAIKMRLELVNMPNNLAPSSVLDAMIAAYLAFSVYQGQTGREFVTENDPDGRMLVSPKSRLPMSKRRTYRR
ncbi:MAG: hypothetical protein K2X01_07610 [Cyanobacteria bacterium]|nr:hypothetical protein [Cyanobacteriota bacterium]